MDSLGMAIFQLSGFHSTCAVCGAFWAQAEGFGRKCRSRFAARHMTLRPLMILATPGKPKTSVFVGSGSKTHQVLYVILKQPTTKEGFGLTRQ